MGSEAAYVCIFIGTYRIRYAMLYKGFTICGNGGGIPGGVRGCTQRHTNACRVARDGRQVSTTLQTAEAEHGNVQGFSPLATKAVPTKPEERSVECPGDGCR